MKLLVAALDSELVAFPANVPGFRRVVTGPGKLQAAVVLDEALSGTLDDAVDEVIVVGTAGALDPDIAPGVYEVGSAIQHDVTDLDGVVGAHVSLPTRIDFGAGLTIATGDSFVSSADGAAAIRALGAQLVDMESYAQAWVAQRAGVPIRIFRAVSDDAGDDAATTWDDTVAACSEQLWQHFSATFLA